MLNKVKQHYNVAHTSHVTPISFRFYEYSYQTLIGDFKWALLAEDKRTIEIYDNQGVLINTILAKEGRR